MALNRHLALGQPQSSPLVHSGSTWPTSALLRMDAEKAGFGAAHFHTPNLKVQSAIEVAGRTTVSHNGCPQNPFRSKTGKGRGQLCKYLVTCSFSG